MLEVLGQRPVTDSDGELGVPDGVVGGLPRGVGPQQGDDGGRQQQDAAGLLGPQEGLQRLEDQPRDRAGAVGPRRPDLLLRRGAALVIAIHHAPPKASEGGSGLGHRYRFLLQFFGPSECHSGRRRRRRLPNNLSTASARLGRSRFWVAGEAALKRLGTSTSRIRIVADQRRVDRFCQEPPEFPHGHSRVRLPLIKM